jgi:allantoin racemase
MLSTAKPIAVKMAEMAIKLKRSTGLAISRISDYMKRPDEILEEFMTLPKGL